MDKRHNKKHNNKNKPNNKNKNKNTNNDNKSQTKPVQLSYMEREAVRDLISLLAKEVHFPKFKPLGEWEQYVKNQQILQRIQTLEMPLKRNRETNPDSRLANIDKFYQWLKDNGVQCDGLKVENVCDCGLGLVATRDIKKDELVVSIPRQLILTEENLQDFEFVKISNMKLAITLMLESLKPDSFWKPYIDLLPSDYSTVLYYTVEEMLQLKGSNALSAALKQCQLIAQLYVLIYYSASGDLKEKLNYDLFRWCVSTVMTRQNLIPRSGPLPEETEEASATPPTALISGLIPFWDMANHRQGTISSYFNMETQQLECSATDDYRIGEQVFIHYGDRSNAELMIHNGFIIPENPKDSVAIKLGLSASDPLFEKRNQLLELLNMPKISEPKVLPPPVHISSELLAFVRVFNMNEEQLEHWIKSERAMDLLHIDCALETALETKTWQYLHTRLMLLLRVFPTTLSQDEEQLSLTKELQLDTFKSPIAQMLLKYRIGEKRILEAALDYTKQRMNA